MKRKINFFNTFFLTCRSGALGTGAEVGVGKDGAQGIEVVLLHVVDQEIDIEVLTGQGEGVAAEGIYTISLATTWWALIGNVPFPQLFVWIEQFQSF